MFLHALQPHRFYVTQQRSGGDRYMDALRTRFITKHMLGKLDNATWPMAPDGSRLIAGVAYPVMQVRDRARDARR